jgi:nicotinamidase-related amidase
VKTALLVIDVQQSFLHRGYWLEEDLPPFMGKLQALIDRCQAKDIPVLQVFHQEENEGPRGPFSKHSGFVTALSDLHIKPAGVFYKEVHSAMFARSSHGQSVEQWLRDHQIEHVIVTGIRTEQCCETTTRHASDLGFKVTYAIDATLTFPMVAKSGRTYSTQELKERTELVLAGRFADVMFAEAVSV